MNKICPLCQGVEGAPGADGEVVVFGICVARADKKNLYCRACIREKVKRSRQEQKAYRAAAKKRAMLELPLEPLTEERRPVVPYSRLTDSDRIRLAIVEGCQTYAEIAKRAKLNDDRMGDGIAQLLLFEKSIKSETVDGVRQFKLVTVTEAAPVRKPMRISSGFSSIEGLMPGRRQAS